MNIRTELSKIASQIFSFLLGSPRPEPKVTVKAVPATIPVYGKVTYSKPNYHTLRDTRTGRFLPKRQQPQQQP